MKLQMDQNKKNNIIHLLYSKSIIQIYGLNYTFNDSMKSVNLNISNNEFLSNKIIIKIKSIIFKMSFCLKIYNYINRILVKYFYDLDL